MPIASPLRRSRRPRLRLLLGAAGRLVALLLAAGAVGASASAAPAVAAAPAFAEWTIYHVYLATFRNGDAGNDGKLRGWRDPHYAGGDLAGLLAALDHIRDLGADAIWISPMFAADTSHGYDVANYFAIGDAVGDPAGGEASLVLWRRLRDEAHRRGLRVVLDLPLNHAARGYDLRAGDPWDLGPRSTAARQSAEKLWESWGAPYRYWNFDHAPTREFLRRVALHWLRDEGADGLRLDYVRGVPIDFWRELAAEVAAQAPGKLLLAECWADEAGAEGNVREIARYARQGDGAGPFSALLDFPLQAALADVLSGRAPAHRVEEILALEAAQWGAWTLPARFLDNHDLARFVDRVGDRGRLAAALGFVAGLPGPLVLFYGTETALGGGPSGAGFTDGGRLPMPWGRLDADFVAQVRRLLALRRELPALVRGERRPLLADDESVVYARVADDQTVLVGLNVGAGERRIELDLAGLAPAGAALRTELGGAAAWIPESSRLVWSLPAGATSMLAIGEGAP